MAGPLSSTVPGLGRHVTGRQEVRLGCWHAVPPRAEPVECPSFGPGSFQLRYSAFIHFPSLIHLFGHSLRAVWCHRNAPFCSSPWLATPLLFRWPLPSRLARRVPELPVPSPSLLAKYDTPDARARCSRRVTIPASISIIIQQGSGALVGVSQWPRAPHASALPRGAYQ